MSLEEHPTVRAYLDTICAQITWPEVHGQVRRELVSHLEEVILELKNDGLGEREAVTIAIHRMGNAIDLGEQLQRAYAPQKNWFLIVTVLLLSGLGMYLMYALEMAGLLVTGAHIFVKSVLYTGLGTTVLFGFYNCDFRKVQPYATQLFTGTVLLWLTALTFGPSVKGVPYLSFGPVTIDYTSIAPYLLVVALAGIFTGRDWSDPRWLVQVFSLFVIPLVFCVISNNIAIAVMYTLVFLVLMTVAGAGKTQILKLLLVSVGFFMILGYHDAGGFSRNNLHFASLLEQGNHTDLAFLYAMQHFGWLAGGMIIFLGGTLLLTLVRATLQIRDPFGRMIVGGLTACFAVQIIWHVLMSLELAPVVAMGLPLISFGGSQTIVHLAAIGVVLNIYKRKNVPSLPGRV